MIQFLLLTLYLFLVTAISVYLGQRYKLYFYVFWAVNLFAILYVLPVKTMLEIWYIILFVVFGIGIITLEKIVVLPIRIQWKCLRYLKLLTKEIFSCFLHPEYSNNIYLFERRLHIQKKKFLQASNKIRKLLQQGSSLRTQRFYQLNQIFDSLLAISQLRNRVTDYTIFSVCKNELIGLEDAIEDILKQLSKNTVYQQDRLSTVSLENAIKAFEQIYHNVLRVTSNEPLVLLLFIFDLKRLRACLQL